MTKYDLRNCPLCGGEASMKSMSTPHTHGWVGCPQCHLYIQWVHDSKSAAERWNRMAE